VKGPIAMPPWFCVTARCGGPLRGPLGCGATNWPLEPQLSVCVDAFGDDGFA
jgi:hypothetical protein